MSNDVPTNPPDNPPVEAPRAEPHSDTGPEARRQELVALKQQFAREQHVGTQHRQPPPKTWLDPEKDEQVRSFIRTLTERKEKRKYQLSIVKSFLEDPLRFGLQTELVPSSTSSEEIEQRKQELQYRIKLLQTLLEIMEGEMVLLEQGEAYVATQTTTGSAGD